MKKNRRARKLRARKPPRKKRARSKSLMDDAALSIKSLSKEYTRGKPVLRDISLDIAPRGFTAVIGPSGTGKSTLIRCINRLVEPTAGQILFQGRDLAKLSGLALRQARRRIGMVFQ